MNRRLTPGARQLQEANGALCRGEKSRLAARKVAAMLSVCAHDPSFYDSASVRNRRYPDIYESKSPSDFGFRSDRRFGLGSDLGAPEDTTEPPRRPPASAQEAHRKLSGNSLRQSGSHGLEICLGCKK